MAPLEGISMEKFLWRYTCGEAPPHESGGEERDDYIGETKCRLGTRIQQHQRSDKEQAINQNYTKKNIDPPDPKDFSILAKNYNNRMKRRIAESLFIKELKPRLNIQKDAYQLRLFR